MTDEFKPCPVCGGEGTYERHEDGWATCSRCGMKANSVAAEALEACGARAERTCHVEYGDDEEWHLDCCGWTKAYVAYCPWCGAKVVE